MIKADLVDRVVAQSGVTRPQALAAVETVFGAMKEALQAGQRIELRGFGVFQVRERKRGFGRNPRTAEKAVIPAGRTVRFKPGKSLRDLEPEASTPLNG